MRQTSTNDDRRPGYLTPKEVARELRVSTAVVYRSIERGSLPCIRLLPNGAIRIPRSALNP